MKRPTALSAKSKPRALSSSRAREFCCALQDMTADRTPGTWRMVRTVADHMGIAFDEASALADECARLRWGDHEQHSVRLTEDGRRQAMRNR